MQLTRHQTGLVARWAVDGFFLPPSLALSVLLELPRDAMMQLLAALPAEVPAFGGLLAPIDPMQEVWAAGVTYLRSRDARRAESQVADVYERVYGAERPELFFKAAGWRVVGPGMLIRVRGDSRWNVPEPELVVVINRHRQIVGYCAGNDVSSRDIEGEATTAMMKRTFLELAEYLTRELDFPHGVFLMTGTCIVPGDNFTLQPDDIVQIQVGAMTIRNLVRS